MNYPIAAGCGTPVTASSISSQTSTSGWPGYCFGMSIVEQKKLKDKEAASASRASIADDEKKKSTTGMMAVDSVASRAIKPQASSPAPAVDPKRPKRAKRAKRAAHTLGCTLPDCKKQPLFRYPSSLAKRPIEPHQQTPEGVNKYPCTVPGCKKKLSSRYPSSLARHLIEYHQQTPEGTRVYRCTVHDCKHRNKPYSCPSRLNNHMVLYHQQTSKGDKNYQCSVPGCKKQPFFRYPSLLTRHLIEHHHQAPEGTRVYLCTVRGCKQGKKPFSCQSNLNTHLVEFHQQTPEGVTIYKCACMKLFSRPSRLEHHQKICRKTEQLLEKPHQHHQEEKMETVFAAGSSGQPQHMLR